LFWPTNAGDEYLEKNDVNILLNGSDYTGGIAINGD
jgi:hypothetical protein